ncbi:transmembrane protease serine 9-like [Pectinophora gossypiella]|uniref:transmembrane protease serine 9-like n=1 Tax=Pectinophora gossypiella TaxID=13191 RepID=UPI00214E9A21|nr:transmembrane protease serine 9-like [Pectinophora gossypiella]
MFRALVFVLAVAAARACRPCTCGVTRGGRVVGGESVSPGEFPWLAALRRDGKVICGATVVARDHLITATHCIYGVEASRLSVLVGEYDVNNTRSEGIDVVHVVQHPDFNRYTYDNDIAVLRLERPLPDSLYRPACLPDADGADVLEGESAMVSGWGSTVEKGPASNIPMKTEVQIWGEEECSGAGYGRRKVTPRMLCANAPGRDACTGDSGGPLLLRQPYFTIVGVVSWGRGCAREGYPGVYARVDRFLPWLRVALRHACTCLPPSLY